jgi:hypothetical protein
MYMGQYLPSLELSLLYLLIVDTNQQDNVDTLGWDFCRFIGFGQQFLCQDGRVL